VTLVLATSLVAELILMFEESCSSCSCNYLLLALCCNLCCSVSHTISGGLRPLVCVVGAMDFVTESLTAAGHCQLTCYSVNADYSNVVQSIMLEQVAVKPTFLQAVDGEDCVCGIVSSQVIIWYDSFGTA